MSNIDEQLIKELEQLAAGDSDSSYGSPTPVQKDNSLKFFRELINSKDSKKFGNLIKDEIGKLTIPVRDVLDIAQYAEAEGLDDVADYLKARAENALATSLSREGFLAQLFVTQIKKEQNLKKKTVKKGLFGTKEVEVDEDK